MRFRIKFSQSRKASYDPTKQIFEIREEVIEAADKGEANRAAEVFLIATEGRTMVSLVHFPDLPPVLEPKPEFLPVYASN